MPTREERKRGVIRYRTKRLPNGEYIHIAVVRKAGKWGGHTVAGKIHKKKNSESDSKRKERIRQENMTFMGHADMFDEF